MIIFWIIFSFILGITHIACTPACELWVPRPVSIRMFDDGTGVHTDFMTKLLIDRDYE